MPDITSIGAGISSIKLALGIAKDLKEASAAYNDAEYRLKISELYSSLSEARISLADAQEEIHQLHNKLVQLQQKLDASDELEFRDGVYYRKVEIPGKSNGPFCPTCYEGPKHVMLSLNRLTGHSTAFGRYRCNTCKSNVR